MLSRLPPSWHRLIAPGAKKLHVQDDGTTRWEAVPAPEARRIVSAYLEPILVEPGIYTALYVGHRGIDVFRFRKLLILWRLAEHPDIQLPRYYRVHCYSPRIIAGAASDLVREASAVLNQRIRRDRIPVASLAGIPAEVQVRTVTVDREQRDLAEVNRYSVISFVKGRA